MPKETSNFGEWLKIRRLAAELTPIDLAKALQMEPGTYRDLEAGRGGLTEAQIGALIKIDKMRISRRDVDHARPPIVAETDGEAGAADGAPQGVVKAQSALDTIIASVQAKHERLAAEAAKPRFPLAAYLRDQAAALGVTPLELARRCRISPMDLEAIEAGFVPGPATLKAMAAGLGVAPETLLGLVEA